MTPETRKTTHYFWTYLNNFEGDDSNISRSLHQSLIEGFMEDKHIIEAQQRVMDEDPDFKLLAVVADAPLSHFRRTLDQLIAQGAGRAGRAARPGGGKHRRLAVHQHDPDRHAASASTSCSVSFSSSSTTPSTSANTARGR